MNKEYVKKLSEGEHIVHINGNIDERVVRKQAAANRELVVLTETKGSQPGGTKKTVQQHAI
jgi:hypothetical protein